MPKITAKMLAAEERRLQKEEHLDLLKQAIAANLDARQEHAERQNRASSGMPPDLQLISAAILMETPEEKLYLESVINDPIRRALKEQLKDLGRRLFRLLGNIEEMLQVAEEVANLRPQKWEIRINIIDKNWDGIGAGTHFWRA